MSNLKKWMINKLSYIHIYFIFVGCLVLSLLPMVFFWVQIHMQRITSINAQINILQDERIYKNLFDKMQEHRLLLYPSQTNDDLNSRNEDTDAFLKTTKQNILSDSDSTVKTQNSPFSSSDDIPSNSKSQSREVAWHDTSIQVHSLANNPGIDSPPQFAQFSIIQRTFLRLSYIQMSLNELILLCENSLSKNTIPSHNKRISLLHDLIQSDLNKLIDDFTPQPNHPLMGLRINMASQVKYYQESVEKLLVTVKSNFLDTSTPHPITLSNFDNVSRVAINAGYQLWEKGLDEIFQLFLSEKQAIVYQFWFILILTLFLCCATCFLGLKLVLSATKRLEALKNSTDQLTEGNLSVRLRDPFQDDIGRVCLAFDRMAERLQIIISNLTKLQGATTALSQGNLKARIIMDTEKNEFSEVALSFNKMADNFENLIQRLQVAGKALTSSALNIALAAKEQENGIRLQVDSTHDIARSSNEISNRTKEFTLMVHEINQSAEKTSDLASKGKIALSEMEEVMKTLVDSSNYIASTLSILNEKAGNITSLTTTITKIADQTNLLSLNASIEAEKAGEFGKGFSVIAKEIRRLADQTAIATCDVEKTISEIIEAMKTNVAGVDAFTSRIQEGEKQAHSVNEQLSNIIEQVQHVSFKFNQVSSGMEAQSDRTEQINKALSSLNHTAKQTSEALVKFQKTVQELNQAAKELQLDFVQLI